MSEWERTQGVEARKDAANLKATSSNAGPPPIERTISGASAGFLIGLLLLSMVAGVVPLVLVPLFVAIATGDGSSKARAAEHKASSHISSVYR